MGRMNWSRIATRERMRRQGVEDIKGKMPLVSEPSKQPRRKLSKAELRQHGRIPCLARGPNFQKQVAKGKRLRSFLRRRNFPRKFICKFWTLSQTRETSKV